MLQTNNNSAAGIFLLKKIFLLLDKFWQLHYLTANHEILQQKDLLLWQKRKI